MAVSRLALALVGTLAVTVTGSALGAPRIVVGGPVLVSGTQVMVVGLGFAPPNEFCTAVTLRVDGRPVRPGARQTDDLGTWTLRFRSTLAPGAHRLELRQTCESGDDGSSRTARATTRLRVR